MLGIGGMMPLPGRPLSAALLRTGGDTLLWDCGEGAQVSWRASGWPFRPTSTILLSHLHADHVAGLPGVLFQLAHSGRTEPVTIYGPEHTFEIVSHLVTIVGRLPFELRTVHLHDGATVDLPGGLILSALAVQHRLPCLAYRLDLPRAPRFDPDRARALGVPVTAWSQLQRGEPAGDVQPGQVLGPPRRGLRLALVTDTSYHDALVDFVSGSDLLVCEAMYAADADAERAAQRGHMTVRQAATLATKAGVRQLLLTHVSPSVSELDSLVAAARAVFPEAALGVPGETLTLAFDDE
jgi:ribonuclease Z